tara:strand:+ start:720 stop:1175 length:456 start_codon:yes stop_codon:yes gene_type:complete
MRGIVTGILGGALAGIGMTAVMLAERRRDAHKTGDIWSHEAGGNQPALHGQADTPKFANEAGHFVASAGFGATYVLLRRWVPGLPAAGIGTAYGAGVYAIDLAGAAPILGEADNRSATQVAGRLALHLLFGAGTALALAMMATNDPETSRA